VLFCLKPCFDTVLNISYFLVVFDVLSIVISAQTKLYLFKRECDNDDVTQGGAIFANTRKFLLNLKK